VRVVSITTRRGFMPTTVKAIDIAVFDLQLSKTVRKEVWV
jgi:hypothetical protein